MHSGLILILALIFIGIFTEFSIGEIVILVFFIFVGGVALFGCSFYFRSRKGKELSYM